MSWNSFDITDLKISPDEGQINLTWTCPRCGYGQVSELATSDLLHGTEVECSNVAICGNRQVYFSLRLDLEYGSYKGLLDSPLAVVPSA